MFVLPLSRTAARRTAYHPAWARAVERLLDERAAAEPAAAHVPSMDVSENDTGYTLAFDLPGLGKDQVKVSVDGRTVHIEAAADAPATAEGSRVLLRERAAPRYERKVALPSDVDHASSQARFENGVLTLTLAKRVPDGARTLTVQ
jgi:HSP20 family protein